MRLKNFIILVVIPICLPICIYSNAQSPYNFVRSPCYLVITGSEKEELYRVNGPSFKTSLEGHILNSCSITLFGDSTSIHSNASKLDIEVKPNKANKFYPVRLQIPDSRTGCHLLLTRDPTLKPPLYFHAKWISQEMMDEYFFSGVLNQHFDTTLFSKAYRTSIPSPSVSITYKNDSFTAELVRSIIPFSGQYLELDFDIRPAKETRYTTNLKAVEISFFHPEIPSIENTYILSRFRAALLKNESYLFWPNDFTLAPGAVITFKVLYWYMNGFEIIESGMVTKSFEF